MFFFVLWNISSVDPPHTNIKNLESAKSFNPTHPLLTLNGWTIAAMALLRLQHVPNFSFMTAEDKEKKKKKNKIVGASLFICWLGCTRAHTCTLRLTEQTHKRLIPLHSKVFKAEYPLAEWTFRRYYLFSSKHTEPLPRLSLTWE